MTSRASRPFSLTVPPEIFRFVTKARMSFSEALVWSGISGRSRTRSSRPRGAADVAAGCRARRSRFWRAEDALEARAQDFGSLGARSELVFLQPAIEPPDHPPRDLDGLALNLVGGDQLVDEPFGVDPALRVHADAELAGVVGNDDERRRASPPAEGAPQRALAGHAHRVGRDRQIGQAELAQAPHPIASEGKNRVAQPASLSRAAWGRWLSRM